MTRRQKRVENTRERLESLPADPLRVRALNEARKQLALNVVEQGGNNRGEAVERIIKYALGAAGEPWCVDFVIWCYGHAGSKYVRPGFTRAVRFMKDYGVVATLTPKPGDIVRYTFDHTGIVVQDNGDGTITTIEGNTGHDPNVSDSTSGGDGVHERRRSKTLVLDFLRVTM